ncbi:sensor histidine kinase [Phytoactinopolyspora endophytica]|uniref:sensor histidine kinase n=1 Tax=Phytoactinopolyspora endophytica TaxID=1642495 RepID=UPI00197C7370|nr:histidine kinase [Phytoactinopolyspora endophytica]
MNSRPSLDTRGASGAELPGLLPGLLRTDADIDRSTRRTRRTLRDWIIDVVCFLIAIGIGLAGFDAAAVHMTSETTELADLVAGAAACIALWWRRRWPVALAVAVAPVSIVASSAGGASIILLFTVAVHRRFTVTMAVAGLHMVCGMLFYGIYPDPELSPRMSLAVSALVVVAVTTWGLFVRARRQLVISLRERARQAESEASLRVEQARHLERERIAREMHDVLAHRISLLSVHAGALEYRPGAPEKEIAAAASVIRSSAHQALQDLRDIIGVLRSQPIDQADPEGPQPTLEQLPALVEESQQAGMRVSLDDHLDDGAQPPPSTVARCAYRVVQEGLTNARKHAHGAGVRVTLDGRPDDGLQVEVRNRMPVGSAARPEIPGAGTGLIGLRERVGLAGGRLEHGTTPDGDFRVSAWLPWPS